MMRGRIAWLALAATGCADYPRDTADTLETVRGGRLRIGWDGSSRRDPDLNAFVARLAERTGSRPTIVAGATEPLLLRLEAGELDLVVGAFERNSPWARRVTFSTPIAARSQIEHKAASRNGEHRWAMEIDRSVAAGE